MTYSIGLRGFKSWLTMVPPSIVSDCKQTRLFRSGWQTLTHPKIKCIDNYC